MLLLVKTVVRAPTYTLYITQLYNIVASPAFIYCKVKSTPTAEFYALYAMSCTYIIELYCIQYYCKNDACKCPSDIQLACRVPALKMCSYYLLWWPLKVSVTLIITDEMIT